MITNTGDNFDSTLPEGVDLEEIGVEDSNLNSNLYCDEKDFN